MQLTIRIYRHQDLDLMLLAYTVKRYSGRSLSAYFKAALRCYLSGAEFPFPVYPPTFCEVLDTESKTVNLNLNQKDDRDMIQLLAQIRYGYRNAFLKNLLRSYMSASLIGSYAASASTMAYMNQLSVVPENPRFSQQPPVSMPVVAESSPEPLRRRRETTNQTPEPTAPAISIQEDPNASESFVFNEPPVAAVSDPDERDRLDEDILDLFNAMM